MNNDTVNLLKECNAGIKTGVNSIDSVLPYVKSKEMKSALNSCKDEHAKLGDKTHGMLNKEGEDAKDPHAFARLMSEFTTRSKIIFDRSDASIANIMTDGCNMGVKSLRRYMNRYENASDEAKEVTNELIQSEIDLVNSLATYL